MGTSVGPRGADRRLRQRERQSLRGSRWQRLPEYGQRLAELRQRCSWNSVNDADRTQSLNAEQNGRWAGDQRSAGSSWGSSSWGGGFNRSSDGDSGFGGGGWNRGSSGWDRGGTGWNGGGASRSWGGGSFGGGGRSWGGGGRR